MLSGDGKPPLRHDESSAAENGGFENNSLSNPPLKL